MTIRIEGIMTIIFATNFNETLASYLQLTSITKTVNGMQSFIVEKEVGISHETGNIDINTQKFD